MFKLNLNRNYPVLRKERKRLKKFYQKLANLWDNSRRPNIHAIGVPEERRENVAKKEEEEEKGGEAREAEAEAVGVLVATMARNLSNFSVD